MKLGKSVRTRLLTLHNSRRAPTSELETWFRRRLPLPPHAARRHAEFPPRHHTRRRALVAPQLPRASVAYSMRPRYSSTVIWIYSKSAFLSTSSSLICGSAKSLTNINGLYCKVPQETKSFFKVRIGISNMASRGAPTCSAHGFIIIWCLRKLRQDLQLSVWR